jgi:hypothetical protein
LRPATGFIKSNTAERPRRLPAATAHRLPALQPFRCERTGIAPVVPGGRDPAVGPLSAGRARCGARRWPLKGSARCRSRAGRCRGAVLLSRLLRRLRRRSERHGFPPQLLSRTLGDSGIMTAPLAQWNSCGGAYMSATLGVFAFAYLPFAFFNLLNPAHDHRCGVPARPHHGVHARIGHAAGSIAAQAIGADHPPRDRPDSSELSRTCQYDVAATRWWGLTRIGSLGPQLLEPLTK